MTLHGECSCGRNRYTIVNPPSLSDTFSIVHDEEAEHGPYLDLFSGTLC